MGQFDYYTDQQLIDRAVTALVEIENRWRKTQPHLRLPIIRQVLNFAKTIPEDPRDDGHYAYLRLPKTAEQSSN